MTHKFTDHKVRLYRTITTSVVVRPNSVGNVAIVEEEGEEVLDIIDSNLFCDTCGMLYDDGELDDHGISEEWDEV